MKITLEFSSHSEMMAFCRDRVAERGYGPASVTPSPHAPTESIPQPPEPVSLGKRQIAVLDVLADGAHRETGGLAEEIGLSVPALSSTLRSLAKRGLVQKVRWGVWGITSNGGGAPIVIPLAAPLVDAPDPETEAEVAPKKQGPPAGKAKAAKKSSKESSVLTDVDDILADL
jgi:hypothetical protein